MANHFERMVAKVPDEVWAMIFNNLDLRDLASVSMTSKRFRNLSLDTMRLGSGWEWTVTTEEVLRCPESYATLFARVPCSVSRLRIFSGTHQMQP